MSWHAREQYAAQVDKDDQPPEVAALRGWPAEVDDSAAATAKRREILETALEGWKLKRDR